ncbi:MAG TPA: lysophospholipid acyltransferase family protein [Gemmatimonadota bacterium]|nr:lysophospholipid acyltransferase family protein [Gemmatimonadota bacterium]
MGGAAELAEYLGARAVVGMARALSPAAAQRLGARLGVLAYRSGARRDIVRAQIDAGFAERGAGWVERQAAACYRHFGREAFVIARLARDVDTLPRRVETDAAAERWIGRMVAGEGVVVVTGHLGNWELAGAYLAQRGVPLSAVVKRQRNARFDAWLAATRRGLGMESVYMDDARILPALLARGRTVVLIADQDARSRGLPVTFLGRPASTFRGPARLALRTGAPLVFASLVRDDGVYRMTAEVVRDRADARAGASASAAELEFTRRWVAALEARVREAPEQYFWFHRRWKSGAAVARARNEAGGGAVPQAEPGEAAETND